MTEKWSAAKINEAGKPWAVIAGDGPFGDRIVAGYVATEADARKLASAPDLLAELDCRAGDLFMLVKAIEANDPKPDLLFRVAEMLRETRAAIAKAEGHS